MVQGAAGRISGTGQTNFFDDTYGASFSLHQSNPPLVSSGATPMTVQDGLQAMKLQDLKNKKPADLLAFAEELEIEKQPPCANRTCCLPSLRN